MRSLELSLSSDVLTELRPLDAGDCFNLSLELIRTRLAVLAASSRQKWMFRDTPLLSTSPAFLIPRSGSDLDLLLSEESVLSYTPPLVYSFLGTVGMKDGELGQLGFADPIEFGVPLPLDSKPNDDDFAK